jgi:hypothetical protein
VRSDASRTSTTGSAPPAGSLLTGLEHTLAVNHLAGSCFTATTHPAARRQRGYGERGSRSPRSASPLVALVAGGGSRGRAALGLSLTRAA